MPHCSTYLVRWHRRIVLSIYSYVYFYVEFNTFQSWNFLYTHSYSTWCILSSVEPIKSLKEWKVDVALSCQTLWPPRTVVHGILQATILKCVAVSFSRGSSQPRDLIQVSHIAGRFFTVWASWETQNTGVASLSLLQRISRPRNWTRVSFIAGGFSTSGTTREALI